MIKRIDTGLAPFYAQSWNETARSNLHMSVLLLLQWPHAGVSLERNQDTKRASPRTEDAGGFLVSQLFLLSRNSKEANRHVTPY